MQGVRRRAWWVALTPVGFLLLTFGAMAVLNEVANPSSALDVTATWAVGMAFGLIFYLPGIGVTIIGGSAVDQVPRTARIAATVGILWMSVVWVVAVADTARMTFDPLPRDEYSWTARLSTPELVVFAVPFGLMLLVNGWYLWTLWRGGADARADASRVRGDGRHLESEG
ncbi:hypothetical protein [Gordonia bronchialis]|uniref:hypothetical protein n=1 Tax=Gordonia bronchialis TaxID=2054 RepID=UPI001576BF4A|nr:hypothetical protein [Gordonia bronchialis]MCC3321896.1 hypothetical protein [Gordonia bronchialis]